jgi:trans-aconitate methyltransferase
VYATRALDEVSWYQPEPATSLRLVEGSAPDRSAAIVDIGSGASFLADRLLADGYRDVTIVDVSDRALDAVRVRLGTHSHLLTYVVSDILAWSPERAYHVWHDRAVFHFLTDDRQRSRYVELAAAALRPGGTLIIATFAADGPTHCSGLPVRRHTAGELASTFAKAFTVEASESEEHVTPAGVVQPFTWSVLRRS